MPKTKRRSAGSKAKKQKGRGGTKMRRLQEMQSEDPLIEEDKDGAGFESGTDVLIKNEPWKEECSTDYDENDPVPLDDLDPMAMKVNFDEESRHDNMEVECGMVDNCMLQPQQRRSGRVRTVKRISVKISMKRNKKSYKGRSRRVSEMTPKELQAYRRKREYERRKYKKVSEKTPEELKAYEERKRKKYKKVSEMTPEELENYKNKVKSGYRYKKVADMTPEEKEAYNAYKERVKFRYHLNKANGVQTGKWTGKKKRVSEMTPKQLAAYNLKKQKYKKVSELSPEEREQLRAKWKEKYNQKKAERLKNMTEEEKREHLEKEAKKIERKKAMMENKERKVKTDTDENGEKRRRGRPKGYRVERKKHGEPREPLDPEKALQRKRERAQRAIMKRIEREAQMTDEEIAEKRMANYMKRMARLAESPADEKKNTQNRWKSWIEKKKKQGKFDEVRQKILESERRRNTVNLLKKKLTVQQLVKQGKSYEEIQHVIETPEAREKRLAALRINAAKKSLRKKLEAAGTPEDEILKQLDHLAKTYTSVRALRVYKPRQRTMEPIKQEEIELLNHPKIKTSLPVPIDINGDFKPDQTDSASKIDQNPGSTVQEEEKSVVISQGGEKSEFILPVVHLQMSQQTVNPEFVLSTTTIGHHIEYKSVATLTLDLNNEQIIVQETAKSEETSYNLNLNGVDEASNYESFSDADDNVDDTNNDYDMNTKPPVEPVTSSSQIIFHQIQPPSNSAIFIPHTENLHGNFILTSTSESATSSAKRKVGRPLGKPTKKQPHQRPGFCELCGNNYDNHYLRIHKKNVHHPYYTDGYCDLCRLRFKPKEFHEHFRKLHIANGDVKWEDLDEIFHPLDVRQSKEQETEGKKIVCKDCGETFKDRNFYKHRKTFHNPFFKDGACSLCGEKFGTPSNRFYEHFIKKHPNNRLYNDPNNLKYERKWVCEECAERFTTVYSLDKHIYYEHGKGSLKENFYKCHECPDGRLFKRKSWYMTHVKQNHPDKVARIVSCPICPEMFAHERQKIDHVRATHPDQCFPCKYCRVVKTSQLSILTHYSRTCPKIPSEEKQRWRDETQVITIERLVVTCEICRSEVNIESLKRHYFDVHKVEEELFPCWICEGKLFKSRCYLGIHLLDVHNMQPDEWLEKISKLNVADLSQLEIKESHIKRTKRRKQRKHEEDDDETKPKRKRRRKTRSRSRDNSNSDVVTDDGDATDGENARPKKNRGRRKKELHSNSDVDATESSEEKTRPKKKRKRLRKPQSKSVVDGDEKINVKKKRRREPYSDEKSEPESSVDDDDADFDAAIMTENLGTRRKSERTVRIKRFVDFTSDVDIDSDNASDEEDPIEPQIQFVKDEKLNTMTTTVFLRRVELDALMSICGIVVKGSPSLDHIFV